ncbi:phytochrome-like protein cph2 [Clostridium puniceum]|uniref:Phytochrome-like protein cph2 n=1 Tax=Clostridium puniceum TaxID=29367 RepID=A0A1S8TCT5_9CLOT|nr:ABC transporter substrate binding protein [Clostridium puniceum]OOM75556.1 phytochrome-like protein cph2 [Clostridium puniceum]
MKNIIKFKISKIFFLLISLLFLISTSPELGIKADEINKNVLIINSYSTGFYWTDGECEGIIDTLNSEENVMKYVEYMDWKRYNSEDNLNRLYEYYKYKYFDKKINLIITTDDAAFNFAIKYRKDLFSDAPLIFGGVHKESADKILKGDSNVAGIYESIDPEGTIRAALKMKPKLKNIYVIHENTETGTSYYNLIKKSVSLIDKNLIIYDLSNYDIDEIYNKTSTLKDDSIVLLDAYNIDTKDLPLPVNKLLNIISTSSPVPIFTTSEPLIGQGCIGGSVISAKVHGIDIGNLALRNLRGEDINSISFIDKKSVSSIYDYNILKKYGFTSAVLPQNSTIINKPSSFYETYKKQIYIISSVFIVLMILIVYLIINIKKKIEIEKKLIENNEEISTLYEELIASEESLQMNYIELNDKQNELLLSEEKYRLIAESSLDIIWEEDMKTNIRKYSDKLFEILGYTNDELPTFNDWYNIIHLMDRDIVIKTRSMHMQNGFIDNNVIYRVQCKTGQFKWILANVKLQYNEAGNLIRMYGAYKDITQLKENQLEINNLAFYDPITKLPNRISLHNAVRELSELKKDFTMFFLDLDNFKIINDSFGHPVGDKLLILVAERINSMNKDEYTAFRLSGDEFIIIYKGSKDRLVIENIASTILSKISESCNIDGRYFHISSSIGIALYPENGADVNELLKNADTAMYYSKESGKNKYTFFNTFMGENTIKKINLHNDLHNAIENNEFVLYYQPIADVVSGQIVGMEALIRWISPKEGFIAPDKFIQAAEESGHIIEIGTWVIRSACNFAKELLNLGHENFYISINVSAAQLMQKNFKDILFNIINETSIPTKYLLLEITESVFMESFEDISKLFSEIRKRGIKIALDDFGCGYSSLTYLKNLPMDVLKIDKSFIDDILSADEKNCIVGLIITLMKQLEFKVIAEGIETKEQLDYINEYKCDLFQGYLVSKPIPKEQILKLFNNIK